MGIFGHKNKQVKLNLRKIYTLGEAMEMANDARYEEYEFVPINSDNIQEGYRLVLKEEVRNYIDGIKRSRRNPEFEQYVTGNGSYKNMDRNVSGNLYNQYQSAKNYSPKEFGLR